MAQSNSFELSHLFFFYYIYKPYLMFFTITNIKFHTFRTSSER